MFTENWFMYKSHMLHVWYIYLHLPQLEAKWVGKYTVRPMDPTFELQLEKVGLLSCCCFFLDFLRCDVGKM